MLLILGKLAMLDACNPHITGILFVVEFWVQGRWIPKAAVVVVYRLLFTISFYNLMTAGGYFLSTLAIA